MNLQAQLSVTEQDIHKMATVGKMREGEATAGKERIGVNQFINEMSYIQNASSNDDLFSPNMFSNNSLSPTNP
mgnify:CR=1 FL=1